MKASAAWISKIAPAALCFYWLVLVVGTHIPVAAEVVLNTSDKVLHFCGYATLAFLLALVLLRSRPLGAARLALVIGITAAWGAIDEITQPWTGRDCDFYDWVADLLGGSTGALLAATMLWIRRRWRSKERPPEADRARAETEDAPDVSNEQTPSHETVS